MAATAPSPEFARAAAEVIQYLRDEYPDPRARDVLSAQPIAVYGTAGPDDWALAGTYGRQPQVGDSLLGLHVGGVGALGEIRVFEDGVRRAAVARGLTVQQQLENTLRHEAEHSVGACPPGHYDCSRAEVMRTYELGGTLDPDQVAAYNARGFMPTPAVAAQVFTYDCGCGH